MSRWLTYVKERMPIPVYVLLGGGFAVSGMSLSPGPLRAGPLLLGFFGVFLFFALLRLMDELKDYDKDLLAHPERPLPRGLLAKGEVNRVIYGLSAAMIAYAALCGALVGWQSAALYLLITAYLWLMYKEFFVGKWLSARPFLYGATHQIIIVPICAFCVAVAAPAEALKAGSVGAAFAIAGAFFSYEICRKLDPKAHPALETYLSIYGARATFAFVGLLCCVAGAAAYALGAGSFPGVGKLLWPAEALVLSSFLLVFFAPQKFKLVEGVATLSLLLHLYALPLQHYAGWPR